MSTGRPARSSADRSPRNFAFQIARWRPKSRNAETGTRSNPACAAASRSARNGRTAAACSVQRGDSSSTRWPRSRPVSCIRFKRAMMRASPGGRQGNMPAILDPYWPQLALGLVLVIALVLVRRRFRKRVAEPLADVLKSVERLSGGDWSTHVEVPSGRIGRALGTALERLRINLSNHAATGRALDIMLDSMNDAVFVTSPDGLIKRLNLAATQMLGWSQMQLLGRELAYVISDQDRPNFNIEQATNEVLELTMRTQSGQTIPVSLSGSVMSAEDPRFQGCIFVARNITERKRAERRIRYLARYDTLTKMPNRLQFQHSLQQAIARNRRSWQRARADLPRPRPLQGGQRHLRARRGRPCARDPLRAHEQEPSARHHARPPRRRRIRPVRRESPRRDRQPPGGRRARARAAGRTRPAVPAQPARALRHRQRRHCALPARRRQRRGPDPRRGRRDVLLEAERRQQPQLLHAGDERCGGRAPDAEGEAAPRRRARRAGDPLPAEGGPARGSRGRRRGAGAMAAARTRRHLARRSSSRSPRSRT